MASKTLGRVPSVSKGRSKSKSKSSEFLYIAEEIPPEEKIQTLNAKLQALQQELGTLTFITSNLQFFNRSKISVCNSKEVK